MARRWGEPMSREAFIEHERRLVGVSRKVFDALFDVVPCDCCVGGCEGWTVELRPGGQVPPLEDWEDKP